MPTHDHEHDAENRPVAPRTRDHVDDREYTNDERVEERANETERPEPRDAPPREPPPGQPGGGRP